MAKIALRVDFKGAPAAVLAQLFGVAKHEALITDAVTKYEGHAHEKEIFHYLNTDEDGDFVTVMGTDGKPTVTVSMQNVRKQLSTMVETGKLKRLGERSARYALPEFEGNVADEDEGEDEDEAEVAA